MKGTCYYCKQEIEMAALRPYGPEASLICYPCMKADPERERLATEELEKRIIETMLELLPMTPEDKVH